MHMFFCFSYEPKPSPVQISPPLALCPKGAAPTCFASKLGGQNISFLCCTVGFCKSTFKAKLWRLLAALTLQSDSVPCRINLFEEEILKEMRRKGTDGLV